MIGRHTGPGDRPLLGGIPRLIGNVGLVRIVCRSIWQSAHGPEAFTKRAWLDLTDMEDNWVVLVTWYGRIFQRGM